MEVTKLLIILSILALLMALATITIAIVDRKKHKMVFLMSQTAMLAILLLVICFVAINGKPVDYSNETNEYKVVAIDTKGEDYKVTLDNGKTVYTDNAMYGEETKYVDKCTVTSKTILGFKVKETSDLLIVTPNVKGFKDMSESEKQSILKEYNSWRLN